MKIYIVQKRQWEEWEEFIRLADITPLRAYTNREHAEAFQVLQILSEQVESKVIDLPYLAEDGLCNLGAYPTFEITEGELDSEPNSTLYLVRLRTPHRLQASPHTAKIIRHSKDFEAVFATRAQANEFAATSTPICPNPFGDYEISTSEGIIFRSYAFSDQLHLPWALRYRKRIRGYDLAASIRSANLEPPLFASCCDLSEWQEWWDDITWGMATEEIDQLKHQLGISVLCTNPFRWAEVSRISNDDYDTYIVFKDHHAVFLEELQNLARSFGIPSPEVPEFYRAPRALVLWWEEYAPQITDIQRAQIWRLVAPYPYEILEVELV